jgi:dienelactone hydrolase
MATVVLLHSALGLTSQVTAWADALRADGHDVVTPDMFGGVTFGEVDEAVAFVDANGGPPAFVDAARASISGATGARVEGPRVYAGFSFGAAVAEILALTEPDAIGLVVMHGALSPVWFDALEWPEGLTAQLHYAVDDPWIEPAENAAFLELADGACEEFVYPGAGHLFGFEGWHEYDDEASHQMFEHVSDFVAQFD